MDERARIVEELMKNEILVEPEVVDYIIERGGVEFLPKFIESHKNSVLVTLSSLEPREEKKEKVEVKEEIVEAKEEVERKVEVQLPSPRREAEEYDWDFKVLVDAGDASSRGKVDDFRSMFLDRYRRLSRIVRKKFYGSVQDIGNLADGEVSVVGIVDDVRFSSRGGVSFTIEDPTGRVRCFYPEGDFILNDEVIGVRGRYRADKDVIYVSEITRPGFTAPKREPAEEDIAAVVVSDIHVGSNTFLRERWEKFVNWLISGEKDAGRVKYLVIGGDLVDGIGIYPGQEEELEILDIYGQYQALAEYINRLPDYIKVIIIPGNHDFVRNAEPQPPLPKEIRDYFNGNAVFLSNPTSFVLHGFKFLLYHGTSLNDLVEVLPGMSYDTIGEIMAKMLEMRHLAPLYGGKVPVAPLPRDFLTIDIVPDVFVTGHVHSYAYDKVRNVHIINASCWQAQTKYQKMMNFNPVPGKVAYVDLHRDVVRELSF